MGIVGTNKVASGSNASGPYTTTSWTPAANTLYLVAINTYASSGNAPIPTVSGNGLTWVQEITDIIASSTYYRLTIFRAMGGSPTTGALTITATGAEACAWSIDEFTNTDTSGTNGSGAIVQSATGKATSGYSSSVTLSAFGDATNNVAYGAALNFNNYSIIQESGYTQLSEHGSTAQGRQGVEYKIGQDTSVTASWSSSSAWVSGAIEVKASVPPPPSFNLFLQAVHRAAVR